MTARVRARTLLLSGLAGLAGLATLTACASSYDASFDYPDAAPVPPFATQTDERFGADGDDPMRGRSVVLDIGDHRPEELVAFYRERFPAADGWLPGIPEEDVGGGDLLCLVSNEHEDYDEYVEVYEADGQYEVFVNRLFVSPEWGERTVDRCGLGSIWYGG